MDHHQRSLRLGAALILCALLTRLSDSGLVRSVAELLAKPNIASMLIYLETGRFVRFSPSWEPVFAGESAAPDFAREEAVVPAFSTADAEAVPVRYNCSVRPDLGQLLASPLTWNLADGEPRVLILHTHTTESYTRAAGESYRETSAYRTLDEDYNMLSIGDRLAELLEAGGVKVIHDRELHDYPSYNGSYNHARKSIQAVLTEYPTVKLVLDLHRDASGDNHNQMKTYATVAGKSSAQLMLVVGTDSTGKSNPHWEENLAVALKVQVQTERLHPGVMRYVNLRSQRFNQDLLPGTLLVEVGAAGNSHSEAITAVEALAEGILALARGTGSGT